MLDFLRKNAKVLGLFSVIVLVGSLIYAANSGSGVPAQVKDEDTLALQASANEPTPGTQDPDTFQPAVIGSQKVTGFEESDSVKEDFVLVSLPTSQLNSALALSDQAQVILPDNGKTTTIALPASQVDQLGTVSTSATVEENKPISVFAEQIQSPVPSWGLDRIDLQTNTPDRTYKYATSGNGVTIYVVDTGVNLSHSDLAGRVSTGFSAINDGRGADDCNGHGTHVAGTAAGSSYGVAKSAKVVPVRVLNCTGSGYISDIISGINWIISTHPGGAAVINLSIGGGYSAVLNSAITDAANRGFTVVAAAGNSSADACNFSPVSAAGVIGVGASTSSDSFASYSNFGSCVDVVAPGSSITSAWIGSSSASNTISGTSMASPHATGLAARILEAGTGGQGVMTVMRELAAKDLISGLRSGTPNLLTVWQLDLVASPSPSPSISKSANPKPSASKSTVRGSLRAPGKAKNLAFTQLSDTELEVTWIGTDFEATEVVIEWFAKNSPNRVTTLNIPVPGKSAIINGLVANRPYEVRVTPLNGYGAEQIRGETTSVVLSLAKNFASPTPTQTDSSPTPVPTDSVTSESTNPGNSGNAPGNSGSNRGNSKR